MEREEASRGTIPGAASEPRSGSRAEEERLLLEVLRQARLTIWVADDEAKNFEICLWNSGAERVYGFSSEEAVGSSYISLFVNPAERARAIEDHRRVLQEGVEFAWNFAAEDLTKDGSLRTIFGSSFRVWDELRSKYVLAEVGVDISNLGRSFKELGRVRELSLLQDDARRRFETLRALSSVNVAVGQLTNPGGQGLRGVVQAIGTAVREILTDGPVCRVWLVDKGETARLAEGSDALPYAPAVSERSVVDEVSRAGTPAFYDTLGGDDPDNGPSGMDEKHSLGAVPLLFGAEPVGVLLMFFRAERRIEPDDRTILQHFGTHAAVAIVMARLATELARRRQEETERVRQAIIQSMLHTVGNEAGRAKLAADSLAEELSADLLLSESVRSNLDTIRSASGRLGQIMSELLSLGEHAYQPVRLHLAEAARVVTRPLARDYYEAIEVRHRIDPELCVQASEYLFREVLSNLTGNAVGAMMEADGGGDLLISADVVPPASNETLLPAVQVDIEDSGPGVAPQHYADIWEYGYTTRGEGHGHGLSNTRGLVAMLGGSVCLLERPSSLGGAHFRIILPMAVPG